jgi:hypothetical protein
MTSMFREAPETDKDGNTVKGPVSMRRILSFILALASIALFVVAILYASEYGWAVFIPGIACLVAALAFLVLTTVGDVQMIIASWKSIQK